MTWSSADELATDSDSVAATLAYAAHRYLGSRELSVEVAGGSGVLAVLDQIDASSTTSDSNDDDPVASLFALYGQV